MDEALCPLQIMHIEVNDGWYRIAKGRASSEPVRVNRHTRKRRRMSKVALQPAGRIEICGRNRRSLSTQFHFREPLHRWGFGACSGWVGGGLADCFQGVDIPPKLKLNGAEGLGERQHSLVGHTLTRSPPALAEDEKGPEKRDAEALFRGTRPRGRDAQRILTYKSQYMDKDMYYPTLHADDKFW
ncbi:hypothetical protein CI102_498 [Trichoderma harzianum]|nr:hypothetical protein CI102_498 [Trichoderma harzianum]